MFLIISCMSHLAGLITALRWKLVPNWWDIFLLPRLQVTLHKVQGFLIPLGFPTHYSARHICCCSVAKSCLTLCSSLDCSPPGSSVHGIFQTRILEWVATPYFRGSSQIRDQAHVSYFSRWIFYPRGTGEALLSTCRCLIST